MNQPDFDSTPVPPVLSVEGLNKTIGGKEILADISFNVDQGELKVLIGPSGSGKSTLLQCLNYLTMPDSGLVKLDGQAVNPHDSKALSAFRRRVGMIFQDFNLFEHLTAEGNLVIALRKVVGLPKDKARQVALAELDRVGLKSRAGLYPAELSGGQKQRVAIARALCMKPEILLLDEPTSALDPELVGEVLGVIRGLAASGMTMIMASHHMEFVRALATEIFFMDKGRIVERGRPAELLAEGVNSRTRAFCSMLFEESADQPDPASPTPPKPAQ